MKRQFIAITVILIILLTTPFAALAQGYSFSLDEEQVVVFLNEDSSISLEYTFVFTNGSGAHVIDFVDVGMPSSSFDVDDIAADVNGVPVYVSVKDYQGRGSGFAVVLGTQAIQSGQSGTVHVTVEKIESALDRDSQEANYASFKFTPTWFDPDLVRGKTDLTVALYLPPGIPADEPRFHLPGKKWSGLQEPLIKLDEDGRIIYLWHDENANGHTPYVFGASFPLIHVPAYATQVARTANRSAADNNGVAGWIIIGTIVVLILGAILFLRNAEHADSRRSYAVPQISIEGYGIKRGLTAVEAAILLEHSLDKVLTMILFAVVKKGAAKIVRRDPLQLDIVTSLPENLYEYEKSFLNAFRIQDARNREEKLREMFIDLIKSVSEKLKGFSREETQRYYRDIVQRAWQQIREANTPELKNKQFDENLDWLMLNHRFGEDIQMLFADSDMTTPQWWGDYDRSFTLSGRSSSTHRQTSQDSSSRSESKIESKRPDDPPAAPRPAAKSVEPYPSGLPGADYAASIVNSVNDFSSKVISDLGDFTDRVHEATNLRPIYVHWETMESRRKSDEKFYESEERRGGASSSADGFFSSLFGSSDSSSSSSSSSSSHRSSSSRHSSCACACAGCACACAGGGR